MHEPFILHIFTSCVSMACLISPTLIRSQNLDLNKITWPKEGNHEDPIWSKVKKTLIIIDLTLFK